MKLPEPFPSEPHRSTNFHIYATRAFPGEAAKRVFSVGFHSCYAAKRWLDLMMGDEKATRIGHELNLDSGIKLRSYELDKILGYEYASDAEAAWSLPRENMLMIARFRRGTWFAEPEVIEAVCKASPDIKTKTVTKTKIVKPAGLVTVVELCKGTSVKPMDARALLRAAMTKPEHGWAFPKDKIPEIKKLIGV